MSNVVEGIGDNKEFKVVALSDVTIYITGNNTSANDTATAKYYDNTPGGGGAKAFVLRTDQFLQILSMNGVTFTDGYSVIKNGSITEKMDAPFLFKMVIRTTVANTNIKLRVR